MARATYVEHAARDWSQDETGIDGGIKKGSPYYWWKFKRGGKRFSLTPPRRSQLTQSSFYATIFDIEDDLAKVEPNEDSVTGARDSAAEALRNLGDECQSSLDNMPEGLQQGSSGEMLQNRIAACGEKADEFDGLDLASFEATKGSKVLDTQQEDDGTCGECGQEDFHEIDCECSDKDDGVNDSDQTAEEYWQEKIEELQNVDLTSMDG